MEKPEEEYEGDNKHIKNIADKLWTQRNALSYSHHAEPLCLWSLVTDFSNCKRCRYGFTSL